MNKVFFQNFIFINFVVRSSLLKENIMAISIFFFFYIKAPVQVRQCDVLYVKVFFVFVPVWKIKVAKCCEV